MLSEVDMHDVVVAYNKYNVTAKGGGPVSLRTYLTTYNKKAFPHWEEIYNVLTEGRHEREKAIRVMKERRIRYKAAKYLYNMIKVKLSDTY